MARGLWCLLKLVHCGGEEAMACVIALGVLVFGGFDFRINIRGPKLVWWSLVLNESTIDFVGDLFLLELLHLQWTSLHRCHESQADELGGGGGEGSYLRNFEKCVLR